MLIYFIRFIHILFTTFVIITPFSGINTALQLHFFALPLLLFHWITNDDTCFLTYVESLLLGKEKEDTFINSIVSPIYTVSSKEIWCICILLFCVTYIRVKNPMEILR
jgi:hypothetical protein